MADSREVMNLRQASQYLGVSPDTLYRYIGTGRFRLSSWEPLEVSKTVLDRWMERKMRQSREQGSASRKPQARRRGGKKGEPMFGNGKQKPVVGLDIGSSSIKAVELKEIQAGLRAGELWPGAAGPGHRRGRRDHGCAAGGGGHRHDLRSASKSRRAAVATAVSGHSVIVKRVSLPLMSEEELYDRIQSEASQHIPFDIADVNLDYQLLESLDSQMDVLLVAVKKDKILNHTNVLAQAGKTPDRGGYRRLCAAELLRDELRSRSRARRWRC